MTTHFDQVEATDSPFVARGKHDKAQRQAAFIDAATAVFAEKGYAAATTREIAERAHCSEGLIHRYFGGKHGLLLAILEQKGDSAAGMMSASVPVSDDLRMELHDVMAWSLAQMWERRDFMRVASAQAIIDPEVGRVIGSRIHDGRVRLIRERLERHRAAGRVREDVDLGSVAQAFAGLAFESGFFLRVVFETDRAEVHRIVEHFTDLVARAIEPAAPSTGRDA